MQEKKKLSLIAKIGVGFIIGLILGFIIGPMAPNSPFIADIVIPLLQLVGNIFLALLKMLIVPLVFSSLIMGASSIGDPKVLGRIGVKTVAFYLGTTVVAIAIGLVLGNIIQPGVGMAIEGAKAAAKEPETVFNVILNIFPANPLKALVEGVMLQVIVFALFLGVAATLIGEKGRAFLEFNSSLAEVMFKVTANGLD